MDTGGDGRGPVGGAVISGNAVEYLMRGVLSVLVLLFCPSATTCDVGTGMDGEEVDIGRLNAVASDDSSSRSKSIASGPDVSTPFCWLGELTVLGEL